MYLHVDAAERYPKEATVLGEEDRSAAAAEERVARLGQTRGSAVLLALVVVGQPLRTRDEGREAKTRGRGASEGLVCEDNCRHWQQDRAEGRRAVGDTKSL